MLEKILHEVRQDLHQATVIGCAITIASLVIFSIGMFVINSWHQRKQVVAMISLTIFCVLAIVGGTILHYHLCEQAVAKLKIFP